MKRNNSSKNAADVTSKDPGPPTVDMENTKPEDSTELIEHLAWRAKATLLNLDAKVAGIEEDLAHNFPMVSHKKHLTGAPAKLWGSLSVAPDITTLSVVPSPPAGDEHKGMAPRDMCSAAATLRAFRPIWYSTPLPSGIRLRR